MIPIESAAGPVSPGRLSVVIVNWNAGDLLRKCVHSILADRERPGPTEVEIIVVDNSSTDHSMDDMAAEFPSVRCIRNSGNVGFAGATNQGIRAGSGEYVLLLNPDTEVKPGALGDMVRFLESHPGAGAVGPMLLNGDGSLQISAYPEPTVFREAWRLLHLDGIRPVGSYRMSSWPTDAAREVDVLTGACILLHRAVLAECGLLDERYFIYSEDQDLCRRIRARGWKIFWLPQSRVVHHGGRSTSLLKQEMFLRLYREKIAYFKVHHGAGTAAGYRFVLLGVSIARLILSPAALLGGSARRRRTVEMARLYSRLVRELLSRDFSIINRPSSIVDRLPCPSDR